MQTMNPSKACELYEKSLALEQESIKTLCNYALFCHKGLKKMDDAEALFKRGVVVADLIAYDVEEAEEDGGVPGREEFFAKNRLKINAAASLLSNYANFLKGVRGYSTEAESMHKKAILLSPLHAGALGNYAKFFMDTRHDFIKAEEMFKSALKVAPEHSGNLTSYARMLKKMGRFDQAEEIYKEAMEVDGDNVIMLCNYANFMKKVRGDMERAKELYERGIKKNPSAEYLQKNYAIFMRDYEKGELKKASSFKMHKRAEKEAAATAKAKAAKEEELKEQVVEEAKALLRGEASPGRAEKKEPDDGEAEEDDEDDFYMDEKVRHQV